VSSFEVFVLRRFAVPEIVAWRRSMECDRHRSWHRRACAYRL